MLENERHDKVKLLTLINLYRLRGLVYELRRPVVAYLALPWKSGREFARELSVATRGNDVVPVL